MSKLSIICYLISVFFYGLSAGSFIAMLIHRWVYGGKIKPLHRRGVRAWLRKLRRSRKLQDIDEMHEHQDPSIESALLQGLGQKHRQVMTYRDSMGSYYLNSEGLLPDHEAMLKEKCAAAIALKLLKDEAFTFELRFGHLSPLDPQFVECSAKLEVVMPERKEKTKT